MQTPFTVDAEQDATTATRKVKKQKRQEEWIKAQLSKKNAFWAEQYYQ